MNIKTNLFFFLLLFTSALTFTLFSCSSPTDPLIPPPLPTEPDSTTQNFTFETFEFGSGGSSSSFNDVWIFDENNIWAVGWVDVTSTTGKTNIVRWDGVKWGGFGRQFDSDGIEGIWAADSSHIYFADGIVLKYENGVFNWEDFNNVPYSNFQRLTKIWGSSTSNIYSVGRNGIIVHYDGSPSGAGWTKIDFDTQWRFDAITGSKQTGIAYASATNQSFNTIIVKLRNNTAEIIYNSANDKNHFTSFSMKLLNEDELLLGLTKVWKFNINTKKTELLYTLPSGFAVVDIAIYSSIDIYFFVDQFGPGEELLHYNGKRFKEIKFSNRNSVIYGGAYTIKDLVVLTGFSNNKAYLVKVKRR